MAACTKTIRGKVLPQTSERAHAMARLMGLSVAELVNDCIEDQLDVLEEQYAEWQEDQTTWPKFPNGLTREEEERRFIARALGVR